MHEYTVEFRVDGPVEVIQALGVSLAEGGEILTELRGKRGLASVRVFADAGGAPRSWDELEEGIRDIYGRARQLLDALPRDAEGLRACWWCGHFTDSFDGGPVLSGGILRDLGEMGVALYIDTYCERSAPE